MLSKVLKAHKDSKGKIAIISKMPLKTKEDLSIAYTPGVAEPCLEIAKDKNKVYDYTSKGNFVAVVSDGSAVLGLGNIGPEATLPVMEGKAILFKEFAGVDAFPICLNTQNVDEIVRTVQLLEPTFGGINLEDISAPRCFEIEKRLKSTMNIPIFHDDQHGTAIVTLAAVINASKVLGKDIKKLKVVISGSGAAGISVSKLFYYYGIHDQILVDSKGIIHSGRNNLNDIKIEMAKITNKNNIKGDISDALKGADVFIGVSKAKLVTKDMVRSMNKDAIVFAMANPDPEILPNEAKEAGAAIIGTGRSDFPNQVNNVLAFPGIFRGVLDAKSTIISDNMKIAAAEAIAAYVKNPSFDMILPSPLDRGVATVVAEAVKKECDGYKSKV